jgi:hypothetical protein
LAGAEVAVGVGHRCGAEDRAVNPTARTGAETRGFRPATTGLVRDADSPLEETGFELIVPLKPHDLAKTETALGLTAAADMEECQAASTALDSASLVQPARIVQSASSVDISTMGSSPMVICRPESVWTEPILAAP